MEEDSPLPPAPPPYIATREEFDRKTAVVLEQSLDALSLNETPGSSHLDDIYEEWDEGAFQKAAAALEASTDDQPSSSSSARNPVSAPTTATESQFQAAPAPRRRSELPTPPSGLSADRIQPLALRKKKLPAVDVANVPSQTPSQFGGKERPSWYSEAQLDTASASTGTQSRTEHNVTQTPFSDPDTEDIVELPPPPFSAQTSNSDTPTFESNETKHIQHLDSPHMALPHRHQSLPPTSPTQIHPQHLPPHRHQSMQQSAYVSPAQLAQQAGNRPACGKLQNQGGPRLRMFDPSLAYGTGRADMSLGPGSRTTTAPAAPSAFYKSVLHWLRKFIRH